MKDIETIKFINENSKYVSIDKAKIDKFIKNVKDWKYQYWLDKKEFNLSEEKFIIFAFLCESMNFCFWKNRNWCETNRLHQTKKEA